MGQIVKLSPALVNQIAAGEVIERPASVVKELVENSLDARATRVDITLARGGMELVQVVDDGCGIAPEDLPLALTSHATSKLRRAEDLARIRTLGFRGEALASIASVAQVHLASRPRNQQQGAEVSTAGGEPEEVIRQKVRPWSGPVGTRVEVRHLFYNAPVRRKFLRSVQTELSQATAAVMRLALAYPQVHFTLKHGQRVIYDLPPEEKWLARIEALFGTQVAEQLLWVEASRGPVRIWGYVGTPELNRPNARMQFLFVNHRPVRDRSLGHALNEAYRGLLLTGRYPVCFLHLEMPPEMVDVNVHPTKHEVRFQDGSRVYSQLLGALRDRFLGTDLQARVRLPEPSPPAAPGKSELQFVDWAKAQLCQAKHSSPPAELTESLGPNPFVLTPESSAESGPSGPLSAPDAHKEEEKPLPASSAPSSDRTEKPQLGATEELPRAIQVHNRYLIVEEEQGIVVIDQHALHERVLYEQLKAKVSQGPLATQRLLVPVVLELSPQEATVVGANRALLEHLGFQVQEFGPHSVALHSHPALLSADRVEDSFRALVDRLSQMTPTPGAEAVLDPLLHTLACKAAVKAGDPLTPEEIQSLLRQRHLAQNTHHCPHGRPTALLLTKEELDRQFLRT